MTITPGLAAGLTLLTQTLDQPGTDVAETVTGLVSDVRAAVDSYLGLSVVITTTKQTPVDLTVLDENVRPSDVATSLLIPLSGADAEAAASTSITVILYAGVPGAFTDLAADLSWITGRPPPEFVLDKHLDPPASRPEHSPLSARWTVDQALGVLIGRGATFEQAERDLYGIAATAGIDVQQAAAQILADLTAPDPALDVP